ncbi:MAG: nuclear transport factor 2 family protein [Chloroflexi bacterium]|nr:nuclear transport factor 2 family protein [Chloroflexota bacterium]
MVQTTQAAQREGEVIERTRAFSQAMVDGNPSVLEALLAADFTYTHKNARVEPRAELIPSVRGGRRNARMDFDEIAVRSYPGATIVSGLAHMRVGPADRLIEFDSRFSAVWVEIDGEWRLAAYHSTGVPDA